jgi:hypothetical protein
MDTNLISTLYLLPAPKLAPEIHQKAFKSISAKFQGSAVPWHLAVPEKAYKQIKENQDLYEEGMKNLDLSYLNDVYKIENKVFDFLQPAKVNQEKYQEYVNVDSTRHSESFKADNDGYTSVVEYSRTATVTGRLKTTSGPRILHLPKKYRDIIESRWGENGTIVCLDYQSLEPRVLCSISGTLPIEERDIYSYIKEKIFKSHKFIERDTIKKIVLSELYGAGIDSIRQQLPNVPDLEWVINEIKLFFKVEELKTKLIKEWDLNNKKFITNYYGRRIKTESSHTLINHYIQSTAVDVSLLGFYNIVQFIKELERYEDIIPLFILHDAIILDVKENALNLLPALCKVGATDIKGFEQQKFYMSIDKEFSK